MIKRILKLVLIVSLLVSTVSCRQGDEITLPGNEVQTQKKKSGKEEKIKDEKVSNRILSDSLKTQILNGRANEIVDPTKSDKPW